jgi:hypothetical protein
MLGHGTEITVEGGNRNGEVAGIEEAMYPALTWTATAVPLPLPPLPLLLRLRFRRNRRVTAFLDRATSSPGTRTFCFASHIACTVQGEDDQRHKFQLILERRKILTGKYGPDDRRVRGDTVSSAGGKKYKPVWPATRGACAPIRAERRSILQQSYCRVRTMMGAMAVVRAGLMQQNGLLWRIQVTLVGAE